MKFKFSSPPLVILGSARKGGDTRKFVEQQLAGQEYRLLDLLDYQVSPYCYEGNYSPDDDFSKLYEELLRHEHLIFATPVYWYSMSGLMKNFFDRITDVITHYRELRRKLRDGKTLYLLSVGANEEPPENFDLPFRLSAEYLGMAFGGSRYADSRTF